MRVQHLKKSDYTVSTWSGGTTTQLYLFPEDGSYAERRFKIRVSSASVDLEESDFTPLPGIDRWITPLVGGFTLTHPGQAPVELGPLAEPYAFPGGIDTHCVGRAVDFNLMLKDTRGRMELNALSAAVEKGVSVFYPIMDTTFMVDGQSYMLEAGELLVVFAEEEDNILWDGGLVLCCYGEI